MTEVPRSGNSWTALLAAAALYFSGLAVYRIAAIEPFPSVSFPAFTSSAGLKGEPRELWVGSDSHMIEWGGTDIRGGAESAIRRTVIGRIIDGSITPGEAEWILEVIGLKTAEGCKLEVRLDGRIEATSDFGIGCRR